MEAFSFSINAYEDNPVYWRYDVDWRSLLISIVSIKNAVDQPVNMVIETPSDLCAKLGSIGLGIAVKQGRHMHTRVLHAGKMIFIKVS